MKRYKTCTRCKYVQYTICLKGAIVCSVHYTFTMDGYEHTRHVPGADMHQVHTKYKLTNLIRLGGVSVLY